MPAKLENSAGATGLERVSFHSNPKGNTSLDYKESWAPKNWCCWTVVLERTLASPLDCKEIQPVHPKGDQFWVFIGRTWCWSWNSNTLATWGEELTHLKRPWCWARLKAGGEGDDRGWDGWMASPTQWTWVWASSGSWWWIGSLVCYSPWVAKCCTRLSNWTELNWSKPGKNKYHRIPLSCGVLKNDTNELIYKTETDSQIHKTNLLVAKREKKEVGIIRNLGLTDSILSSVQFRYILLYIKAITRTYCVAQRTMFSVL